MQTPQLDQVSPASRDLLARNVCGRAHALTALVPVRWWWVLILRAQFWLRERLPAFLVRIIGRKLEELSFIFYARWSIIDKVWTADGKTRRRLRPALLLFESNFSGAWEEYIDAFSYVLPGRMRLIWQGAYDFPGPTPAGPFKDYIRRHEHEADHYYCAYPDATVTTVLGALTLHDHVEVLVGDLHSLDAETFAERYALLLTEVQQWL